MVAVPELNVRTGRPPQNSDSAASNCLVLRAGGDPAGAQHVGYALNGLFIDFRTDKRQKRDG
jgi:hypothetical protein